MLYSSFNSISFGETCADTGHAAHVDMHSGHTLADGPGEIGARKASQDCYLAAGEGLIEINGDHVAVLADMAIAAEKIDEAKVEEARQRAEARLQEKLSDEEAASVNASLTRSLAQLQVKRRRRL
jgi:F-type H+-transporting ATPase subunit epsilon